jgi:DNA-binding MarR family transcriptional regulator
MTTYLVVIRVAIKKFFEGDLAATPKGRSSKEKSELSDFLRGAEHLTLPAKLCIYTFMSKERDFSATENCICFNLRRVARVVTNFFEAELRKHGIRPTQGTILMALNARESWSMADLSDALGMDRTTLVRNLGPLQREGLARTAGGGRGGRVELSITAKGRKNIEECAPTWRSTQSSVVGTLGDQRWSAILSDLETAAQALKK